MKRITDPRSGYYHKNGRGVTAYESFVPQPLQHIVINVEDKGHNGQEPALLALADKALEHLKAKDAEGKEMTEEIAESSVRLEWNVPSMVLLSLGDETEKKKRDIDQQNMVRAIRYGIDCLERLPLSGRLLKDLHWVAMQGEHNEKKYPGEFRTSPIWMGDEHDTLESAPFIPPAPDDMLKAFYDLEQYINADDDVHPLIKAALIHYQFEVIHPFIDGNGRVGQLLTLLFLNERGILKGAAVNLPRVFHLRQFPYFTGLASVEISGTYEKWVRFFLEALMVA